MMALIAFRFDSLARDSLGCATGAAAALPSVPTLGGMGVWFSSPLLAAFERKKQKNTSKKVPGSLYKLVNSSLRSQHSEPSDPSTQPGHPGPALPGPRMPGGHHTTPTYLLTPGHVNNRTNISLLPAAFWLRFPKHFTNLSQASWPFCEQFINSQENSSQLAQGDTSQWHSEE